MKLKPGEVYLSWSYPPDCEREGRAARLEGVLRPESLVVPVQDGVECLLIWVDLDGNEWRKLFRHGRRPVYIKTAPQMAAMEERPLRECGVESPAEMTLEITGWRARFLREANLEHKAVSVRIAGLEMSMRVESGWKERCEGRHMAPRATYTLTEILGAAP